MIVDTKKNAKRIRQNVGVEPKALNDSIGIDLNFSANEAYKMLRTNLNFSFTGDEKCHVVGVTSTFSGEGKSLTSINLAYTIAQAGHRVLLLECDMRLPTLSQKIQVRSTPGLAECLIGDRTVYSEVLQHYTSGETSFDAITAGSIPPNPSELLGAPRMERLMARLTEVYEYIIVDLPPVSQVSDPVVMSKNLYGYIVVVRHNYCERKALRETIRQLKYTEKKILGFVYNGAAPGQGRYSKRYYKSGYYQQAAKEKKISLRQLFQKK